MDDELRLPLLEQLLDEDPDSSVEAPLSSQAIYSRAIDSLKADLLDLLNTRERCRSWPKQLKELDHSVLSYGIQDVSGAHLASPSDRTKFLNQLGPVIRRCDPRFASVRIVPDTERDASDRTLHFKIEALVKLDGGAEEVSIPLKLEPVRRNFES